MTFEQRIRFHLKDIQTISLRCSKCGTVIAQDLSRKLGVYTKCPNDKCEQSWELEDTHHLHELLNGLEKYLRSDSSHRPFDINFELKDPAPRRLRSSSL